jgi:hypothetical protein
MDRALDPDGIERRVFAAPTLTEVGALTIGVALVATLFTSMSNSGVDWGTYVGAVNGDYVVGDGLAWYYPYWWLWPLEALTSLGDTAGYVTLGIANLLGIFFAARVFGGHPALALIAYHTLMVSFTGTITGLLAAAVAGLWWALQRRRMVIAGLLATFSLAKLGWGIPLVVAMVLVSPATWRERSRAVVSAGVIGLASLAVYGWWPADVIERADTVPPAGNGSLWHFVGPVVLVLWIPVLVTRMDPRTRITAAMATAVLATPYVQQYDFALLFTMGHSWIGLVSWARPLLVNVGGTEVARAVLTVIPATYYCLTLASAHRTRHDSDRHYSTT